MNLKIRKLAALMVLVLAVCACVSANAEVERNGLLDSAFSMLEEGNIFVERYNALTGAEVKPYF